MALPDPVKIEVDSPHAILDSVNPLAGGFSCLGNLLPLVDRANRIVQQHALAFRRLQGQRRALAV